VPDIATIVPHRGPMLWLDRICEGDDRVVVCAARVRDDAPFVRDGKAAAVVALEYMAQGAAALLGLQRYRRATPVSGGFLVAVPSFELGVDTLAVGDELLVRAEQIWPEPNKPPDKLVNLECSVTRGDVLVARATLNVVRHADHG
jgi:predicted hotdog family 3-hydroxylacyl-ACP dehydratase